MKALSQAPTTTETTEASGEFVKVEGGLERTSAEGSVVLAYLLMLAIMVFFLWRTIRVQTALNRDTDTLLKALEKDAS